MSASPSVCLSVESVYDVCSFSIVNAITNDWRCPDTASVRFGRCVAVRLSETGHGVDVDGGPDVVLADADS